MTQGGKTNRTRNCTELRSLFKAGPAIYKTEIATEDVNRLKVRKPIKKKIN